MHGGEINKGAGVKKKGRRGGGGRGRNIRIPEGKSLQKKGSWSGGGRTIRKQLEVKSKKG